MGSPARRRNLGRRDSCGSFADGEEAQRIVDLHNVQLEKPVDVWANDPDYPIEDWRDEVSNDDTRLGYWVWVASKKEQEE